jgi:hypothetical protein
VSAVSTPKWTESQNAVEEFLGGHINSHKVFDLSKLTHDDFGIREAAINRLPEHLKVVYKEIKSICGKTFLPNPRETLRVALLDFALRLWRHCGKDKFAEKSADGKLKYAKKKARQAANVAVQRTGETQLPIANDRDIRIKSSNINDGGMLTGKKGEAAFAVAYLPRRRPDWKLANEYEEALITKIDAERKPITPDEPESTYERVIRLLGSENGEWFWNVTWNHAECSQRDPRRINLNPPERKRLQRLRRVVGWELPNNS